MAPDDDTLDEQSSRRSSRPPSAPGSSRIDTLPQQFVQLLSRKPCGVGDVIGARYRLIEPLGHGAMGQLFVAENLAIGRRVAVKMLKPELLADAEFRQRFQHEAQAFASIEHRNVARFFDLVVGDPTFLVMEFVPGPTLAEVLRAGRLELARALNIGRRLCWALDAAHRAGVIHRDIKPSNVILAPDPEQGEEPKLIDFGLAKLASAVEGDGLTRTGQIVGTPQYMSPEQIANQTVDARSDVYSLGCVLYQMFTGGTPFGGRDDIQILYQQLHGAPTPLRERVPELPAELAEVIGRSLAKAPEERYASMRELADALATVNRRGASQPGASQPDASTPDPPKPEPAQRPSPPAGISRGLALGFAVVTGLAAGTGVWMGSRGDAGGGQILVTSQPSDAVVEVDGRRWHQTTPTAVTGLTAGRHEVTISAPAHDRVVHSVAVEAGRRASLDAMLAPLSRSLTVETVPPGAQVFVDGHPARGATPLTVTLTQDDFHELRVEQNGYETATRAIKPEDTAAAVTIALDVEKHERGTMWVDGPPAEVFIDDAPTGTFAPSIGMQLTTGAHRVELRSDRGKVLAGQNVQIKRGDVLHISLDPRIGTDEPARRPPSTTPATPTTVE